MSETNTLEAVEYAAWDDWNAKDYINEYYADITLDGHYAVEWVVESMQKLEPVDVALEFGTGPVVIFSMPMVLKAREVHMAEYLAANRAEVDKWLQNSSDAKDWLIFTKDMLEMEGVANPTDEQAREREQFTRERIKGIVPGDVSKSDPLGPEKRGFYPLVVSYCCADSSTDSKQTWDTYMKNIASMVKTGGTLVLAACEGHRYYCVGERCFPGAGVNALDLLAWLRSNGFVDIDVRSRQVPDNSEQGFSSIMFGRATKA